MQALILVDIQNDFLPGGAVPVAAGDEVIPVANRLLAEYPLVVATQDWHPPDHLSFASQHPRKRPGDVVFLDDIEQILWPDHCVQGTAGADFASALDQAKIHRVFQKGVDRQYDSYSGFYDNARQRATGLHEYLLSHGVDGLHVMGLATDYCVKFTALDARDLGFRVGLIHEGVRGVDIQVGDCDRALQEMDQAGVEIL